MFAVRPLIVRPPNNRRDSAILKSARIGREPGRYRSAIVIGENHILATRSGRTDVAGTPRSAVLDTKVLQIELALRSSTNVRQRCRTSVVNHGHFEQVFWQGLGRQRVQRGAQQNPGWLYAGMTTEMAGEEFMRSSQPLLPILSSNVLLPVQFEIVHPGRHPAARRVSRPPLLRSPQPRGSAGGARRRPMASADSRETRCVVHLDSG